MKIPNANRAVIDIRKLTDYALNPDHPEGGDKARVFAAALGFTADNSELLENALLNAVQSDDAIIGKKNAYGQRYRVDFEITGPNGKTAIVRSGWIIRFDEDFPRLATVYVV